MKKVAIPGLTRVAACLLAVAAMLIVALPNQAQAGCEAGVADGTVTDDGRSILWKLRMLTNDGLNDVHYFADGVEHYSGLGNATYSYLGMGPAGDSNGGPVRQGVNSAGLAIGFNDYGTGGWEELHHYALGQASTIGQVSSYLQTNNKGEIEYFTDAQGGATLWENDTAGNQRWEYNTTATARDSVYQNFDSNPDEITYSGWVARANTAYTNTNGMDDLETGEGTRSAAAQTVTGRLVDSGAMNVKNLAAEFFRHDVLAPDISRSSLIVHGVLPTEDARLTTMWTALGHPEGAIFVPVWIHGVESGGANVVPDYLDNSDGDCAYTPAKGMIDGGFNEAALQLRTLPFEGHLFDVVTVELLPQWRLQDWNDSGVVEEIGKEMKRVQEQMDADAYSLLDCLFATDIDNFAPLASIDGYTPTDLSVAFSKTDSDDDSISSWLWNYGDGTTDGLGLHTYEDAGTYLTSFTVTDNDGVSYTDWEFVTVTPEPATISLLGLGGLALIRRRRR